MSFSVWRTETIKSSDALSGVRLRFRSRFLSHATTCDHIVEQSIAPCNAKRSGFYKLYLRPFCGNWNDPRFDTPLLACPKTPESAQKVRPENNLAQEVASKTDLLSKVERLKGWLQANQLYT
jgi:hypothetical protein